MAAEWSAQIAVDEGLARRLIAGQFPELPLESVVLVSRGWDNTVWLVDDTWAFRFPRREIAVPLVDRELTLLPLVEPHLPAPIPAPVFSGRPSHEYPWPFSGAAYLPGTELGSVALSDDAEVELAGALGRFLRALHAPELAAEVGGEHQLPVDVNARADMSRRVPRTRTALAELAAAGLWEPGPAEDEILHAAETLLASPTAVLIHGDLHFRHVLVENGALSGVIDWGDVCLADPSVDLQLFWSAFSPAAREAFVRAYGPIADERLLRARVFALFISAILARYAHDEALVAVERAAIAGLERALT
jgi:aminoglycoside phosphotransferase (APT) family kinase protein